MAICNSLVWFLFSHHTLTCERHHRWHHAVNVSVVLLGSPPGFLLTYCFRSQHWSHLENLIPCPLLAHFKDWLTWTQRTGMDIFSSRFYFTKHALTCLCFPLNGIESIHWSQLRQWSCACERLLFVLVTGSLADPDSVTTVEHFLWLEG